MPRKWDHQTIDRANELSDHLIADRLRHDALLLRSARQNLEKWMANAVGGIPAPFLEWSNILNCLTRDEVAKFLESDTPKVRRLRQSSPFMGLSTELEKRQIMKIYEEAAD